MYRTAPRWSEANRVKLDRFLEGARGGFAVFDGDNTLWSGDLGDSALVHFARTRALSPRIAEILPEQLDVPEGSLVDPAWTHDPPRAGRIFPSFSFAETVERGSLEYEGVLFATYALLEARSGCVAFDREARAEDAIGWFPEEVRGFFGASKPWPPMLDTGPRQRELARRGELGAYSQIALWSGLDKTPAELEEAALAIFGKAAVDTPARARLLVEEPLGETPVGLEATVAGRRPGLATMLYGTAPRPEMIELVASLRARGVEPVVVTASQVDLVKAVVERHYGGAVVLGMKAELAGGRYGATLLSPATYGPGKVDAIRQFARERFGDASLRPVFAAGDANTDLEMLAYAEGTRLFFDRGKRPFLDLADHLFRRGHGDRTLVQDPL